MNAEQRIKQQLGEYIIVICQLQTRIEELEAQLPKQEDNSDKLPA